MSAGLALLKKMLEEGRPLSTLSDNGIPLEALEKDELRVYQYIGKYFKKYSQYPNWGTVKRATKVKLSDFPDNPLSYWIDQVMVGYQRMVVHRGFKEIAALLEDSDDSMDEVITRMRTLSLRLDRQAGGDRITQVSDLWDDVVRQHDVRQVTMSMSGVPFGLEYLDEISDGAQPTDTVALVGRPGVGKTYFLLNMARYANANGAVPLVVPMEMSAYQTARRLTALATHVPANKLRLGRLSYYGREELGKRVAQLKRENLPPFYIMEGSLKTTIEDIATRVQELRPTILYIDGAYMVQTATKHKAKWERVSEVAEYMKMMAKDFNIPVIASWQFNRKGPGSLGNIMYSDSVGQLASIVAAIENDDVEGRTQWDARSTKRFTLLKGREGEKGKLRVMYDMTRMEITQIEVLSGYTDEIDARTIDDYEAEIEAEEARGQGDVENS